MSRRGDPKGKQFSSQGYGGFTLGGEDVKMTEE